jgi:2C-methyl-D-erythritol 2,4-cyclodiphosphate synthase
MSLFILLIVQYARHFLENGLDGYEASDGDVVVATVVDGCTGATLLEAVQVFLEPGANGMHG